MIMVILKDTTVVVNLFLFLLTLRNAILVVKEAFFLIPFVLCMPFFIFLPFSFKLLLDVIASIGEI
ncbi:hypothetical protein SDC9_111186 [bioreactor metagenome]|uniref:Uncharacterized protein n=1 Tax=bioreactor metagenome TaxID=1076179 RepID=A0A645BFT1_9ZZZZ